MNTISNLLAKAEAGERDALDSLFAALYQELHRLAEHQLRRSAGEATLGTTTLLHDAYLNLSARDGAAFPDRGRFLAYASKVMRGLVIDYSRARRAKKRGGEFEITRVGDEEIGPAEGPDGRNLDLIGEGLEQLAAIDPWLVEVVDLHFFCGFTFAEIGALRGKSERTVQRDWRKARLLLENLLTDR